MGEDRRYLLLVVERLVHGSPSGGDPAEADPLLAEVVDALGERGRGPWEVVRWLLGAEGVRVGVVAPVDALGGGVEGRQAVLAAARGD